MSGFSKLPKAADRGYDWAWKKLRLVVLKRDLWLCQCECCKSSGRILLATEVDHVVPKAKGGSDDPSNLQAINAECHRIKSLRDRGCEPKLERKRIGVDGFPI